MNGHPDQKLLALYAGGELAERRLHTLAAHLNLCAHCQSELADIQSARLLLAGAFPEPSDLDLQTVHDSLAKDIRYASKRQGRPLLWAAFVLTAAALFALVVSRTGVAPPKKVRDEAAQLRKLPPMAAAISDRPLRVRERRSIRVQRPYRDRGIRSIALMTRSGGPSQLKLSTADPNVVILIELDGVTRNP